MNWLKERVGLQDPIYGPDAIQTVSAQADAIPSTELIRDDLRWFAQKSSCVETQTFYVTTSDGHVALAQVIYNSVAGIRTTCQFSSKIFYPDGHNLFNTDALDNYRFEDDKHSFHADKCSVVLSPDGDSYTIKSSASKQSIVDLKFTRVVSGFVVGKNGTSTYGTDVQKPWGSMRHAFWPRCKVEGSIMTQGGAVDMSGFGLFIHALQGMSPQLAAARWNFANFQSSNYSAVMMEFTTPPSYGSTVVNVGGIATNDGLLFAGARHFAKHTEVKRDPETGWLEPVSATFSWKGQASGDGTISAEIDGSLGTRADRIDIMAQVPKFAKTIIASVAGARPFIYQYTPQATLKLNVGSEEKDDLGQMFVEATFITGEQ